MSQNCINKIPPIGPTQPGFMYWSDWRNGGCSGTQMGLPEGDYNLLHGLDKLRSQFGSVIGANDIDSVWVPPNGIVDVNGNGDNGSGPIDRYTGVGGNTGYPGLYNNLDGRAMGNNDIDVINARYTKPWQQHLQECCTGLVNDQRLCGAYKPGASVCDVEFAPCTADDMKTVSKPTIQQRYCTNKLKNDPALSDMLKVQFCNTNPTSSWCSCLTLERDADFQAWARAFGQKFPQIPVNKMSYVDKLGLNPCRSDTTDLTDIFLTQQIIADRNNLPNAISIQDLTISGNNNIVNNDMQGGIGNTNPSLPSNSSDSSSAEAPPIINGISNQNLMYLLILIVAVLLGYSFLGGNSEDQSNYSNQYNPSNYSNPYPPMQFTNPLPSAIPPMQYGTNQMGQIYPM